MLSSATRRCSRHVDRSYLLLLQPHVRCYTQQKTARAPRSMAQQTTVNPSPGAQVKNRTTASPSGPSTSAHAARETAAATAPAAVVGEKLAAKVRRDMMARETKEAGQEADMIRMSLKMGSDPWAQKMGLLDLCIPTPLSKARQFSKDKRLVSLPKVYWQTLRENMQNNFQNILSMYRLASDYAFAGIITKWALHPRIFTAKSTKESAWVAPFRRDILERYKCINESIATGDARSLKDATAYEYHDHAMQLLRRNAQRAAERGVTYTWQLHSLLAPVRILSLRAFPAYYAAQEPAVGNRNCVQAVVRFETLQSLTARNRRGQVLKPDGAVAEPGWAPEPKRVLEYLVFENKMFYRDGWYARDQMYEGVKGSYREA